MSIRHGSFPLDQDDVRVKAAEVVAAELAQGVDVLDLLGGKDVEIHALYPLGDLLPLGGQLSRHELAQVGAKLEAARILDGEGCPLLDFDPSRPWRSRRRRESRSARRGYSS